MFKSKPLILATALWVGGTASVVAQTFPDRPVRLVVTFVPGGGADLTARVIGAKLQDMWKQSVVVENRPGAGGNIGADNVFHSPADGYSLLVVSSSHAVNAAVLEKPTFDFLKDFQPIALTTSSPVFLAVNPRVKASNLRELTALLRASPGKYAYGTCGIATTHHFAMEQYKYETKTVALHIPERGCAPAVTDVIGGQMDLVAVTMPAALAFVRNGNLRAIAVTSQARSGIAPDIPTFAESGVPELKNYAVENYYGFMVKAGTPAAIAAKLEADIRKSASDPDVQKKLQEGGMDMFVKSPAESEKLLSGDVERYKQVAKVAGIKSE
jgi:tripartite-type tricarboxylate transporter receptor subunit TctC